MAESHTSVLGRARAILLDFDGPVCSVFAGQPVHQIASELIKLLRRHGATLPTEMDDEDDLWKSFAGPVFISATC
jgi:hypothetical protein